MKFSLPLMALAVNSAVNAATIEKQVTTTTAVEYDDPIADAFCLGTDMPAFVVSRTGHYVSLGWYLAIPGPINVTDCARYVAVRTPAGKQIIANIVGITTDKTLKLSAAPWASVVDTGVASLPVTYSVAYD